MFSKSQNLLLIQGLNHKSNKIRRKVINRHKNLKFNSNNPSSSIINNNKDHNQQQKIWTNKNSKFNSHNNIRLNSSKSIIILILDQSHSLSLRLLSNNNNLLKLKLSQRTHSTHMKVCSRIYTEHQPLKKLLFHHLSLSLLRLLRSWLTITLHNQ